MTSPSTDEGFSAAVELVRGAVEKLKDIWNDVVDGFNMAIKVVPGSLLPGLVYAMKKLSKVFGDMLEKVWKVYTERGSAGAVRAAASDWNNEVGAKTANQGGAVGLGQLPTTGYWTSPAATRYVHVVNGQIKALTDVKTITDGLQTTLNEIANAMRHFWQTLAIAVGSYVVLMAATAVATATVVEAAPAITAAIGFTVAFLGVLNELTRDFANALDTNEAKLEQLNTTGTAFVDGNWPPSTADDLVELATRP
jgi:hypothetical protein